MISILLKKQWRSFFVLLLLFCGILFVKNSIDSAFSERYYELQREYMEEINLSTRDDFFETLEADTNRTKTIVSAIENYESYDQKYFDKTIDPLLAAAGAANYVNYDMVIWRQEMLQMPGLYANTISDDYYMMIQLSQRLLNQCQFENNLYNNIEIMRRGLRRNDGHAIKYEAILDELHKIDTDFEIQDTLFTDRILEYMEYDYFILIMIVLVVFNVFSNLHQNKISCQIRISKMNTTRFCISQIIVSTIICILFNIMYYMAVIFVLSSGNITEIAWNLPIQAINNYEAIPFAISVWEYVLHFVLFKTIFSVCLLNVILFISALSRNSVMATMLSLLLCGGLILISQMNTNMLVIGSCKILIEDLAFICVGKQAISKYVCSCCMAMVGSLLVAFGTIWGYTITTKRLVK